MKPFAPTMRHPVITIYASFIILCLAAAPIAAQTKLLRFPDVHGDKVVFTYAGDLWTASTSGGTATRLTAHPGLELFAKFSPDGKWIAFTGQYDGDEQVYVIPAGGGVPKQLTFYPAHGPLTRALGLRQPGVWLDARRQAHRLSQSCAPAGRSARTACSPCPPRAAPRCRSRCRWPAPVRYSPDGKQMVYSPLFRDFRSEKRYGGGQANRLWIFDFATNTAKPITEGPRAERDRDVDRQHDLLQHRQDGHVQHLVVRRGQRRTQADHAEHEVGYALAEPRRRGPDHLRERGRAAAARHEDGEVHADFDHRA